MKFMTITDYPYTTVKKYFATVEEAEAYFPSLNEPAEWFLKYGPKIESTKALAHRIYPLKSYKETILENGTVNINYNID